MTYEPMSNRLPVGPGSRGGLWHDPEYRRAYMRAWRRARPEYRERERLRQVRQRAIARGEPVEPVAGERYPRPFPRAAVSCNCGCGCDASIPARCGFCDDGFHDQ